MKIEAFIEVYNEKGELEYIQEANSLIKAFWQILYSMMTSASITYTLITGSTLSTSPSVTHLKCNAGAGVTNCGLVIGSGSTPVNPVNDYKLASQLITGISYSATTVDFFVSTTYSEIRISRDFLNQSGADVTVNEVGLYTYVSSSSYQVCVDRTVLATPVVIANDEIKSFLYRIRQTY